MCLINVSDLIYHTLHDEWECTELDFSGLEVFIAATAKLQAAGLSQDHLQLLLMRRFSDFRAQDFMTVKVMALAIERGTATVAHWHQVLRMEAYSARMGNRPFGFVTETLPDLDAIDAALGLTVPCYSPPSLPETAGSCGRVDWSDHMEVSTR